MSRRCPIHEGTKTKTTGRAGMSSIARKLRGSLHSDMPAGEVEPDDRTLEMLNNLKHEFARTRMLNKSEHVYARMRTSQLKRFIDAGDVTSAKALMDKLKETGKANVMQFTLMLRAYRASAEMRRIIETEMPVAGVEPDVATFNTLVGQLMFEGDLAGVQRVLEEEMPAAGVEPDDRTLEMLNKSEHVYARISQLRFIDAGTGAARTLMIADNKKHFAVMRKHYGTRLPTYFPPVRPIHRRIVL